MVGTNDEGIHGVEVGMEVTVLKAVATIVLLVAFGILLWLAWKIAVFLFMLWIIIGVASAAMKR